MYHFRKLITCILKGYSNFILTELIWHWHPPRKGWHHNCVLSLYVYNHGKLNNQLLWHRKAYVVLLLTGKLAIYLHVFNSCTLLKVKLNKIDRKCCVHSTASTNGIWMFILLVSIHLDWHNLSAIRQVFISQVWKCMFLFSEIKIMFGLY